MEDICFYIGKRIREEREKRGLSQAQVGDWLGLEKSAISKYENGEQKRGVPIEHLFKIANEMTLPINAFLPDDLENTETVLAKLPPAEAEKARLVLVKRPGTHPVNTEIRAGWANEQPETPDAKLIGETVDNYRKTEDPEKRRQTMATMFEQLEPGEQKRIVATMYDWLNEGAQNAIVAKIADIIFGRD